MKNKVYLIMWDFMCKCLTESHQIFRGQGQWPQQAAIRNSIKFDFPSRFFDFLQECVQEGVYFGAHMVPSDEHFLKVVSGLQMACE